MPDTLLLTLFIFHFSLLQAALPAVPRTITCHDTCGSIPIKYPFGSGFGCGHPDFASFLKCDAGTFQFSTTTGVYPISSIDYNTSIIVVTDPLMSNCSSMQNSGSFGLDPAAPFKLAMDAVFVLLGCSTTSPVFDTNQDLCDTGSASHVCTGLYSCEGVTGIGLEPNAPISTCCVYDASPVGLGSGYVLELPKLQCSSYTCVSGYGESERDPKRWDYGIPLQFNSSFQTDVCKNCEASGGVCGFTGLAASFACICRNGINTTANCYGQGYAWSVAQRLTINTKLSIQGLFSLWILFVLCGSRQF